MCIATITIWVKYMPLTNKGSQFSREWMAPLKRTLDCPIDTQYIKNECEGFIVVSKYREQMRARGPFGYLPFEKITPCTVLSYIDYNQDTNC